MVIIHEVFVNLSLKSSANSLDCFVPRNDRYKNISVNLSDSTQAGSSDCFVPTLYASSRNDKQARSPVYVTVIANFFCEAI
jgi:hypothetical protein